MKYKCNLHPLSETLKDTKLFSQKVTLKAVNSSRFLKELDNNQKEENIQTLNYQTTPYGPEENF